VKTVLSIGLWTKPARACTSNVQMKPTRTVIGDYPEQALRKGIEGKVTVCLTVDGHGRVTDVSPISGPAELVQPSIDAAKQWEFEPPPIAPVKVILEDFYQLPPRLPIRGRVGLSMIPYSENKRGEELSIIGELHRPLPKYPEALRAEGVRGQEYVSMVVNPDGNVSDVIILKSLDDRLDPLTLQTVQTWKFKVTSGESAKFFLTFSFY
jgi:TonB family protein